MKKVYPERSRLIPGTNISVCRNVQIISMRGKCRAGAERVRGRYRQIDNMKHKYQLHVPNCQISNSSQIAIN